MNPRPLTPVMRWSIAVASLLVLGAGAPLMLRPENTDESFVFSITPPITALFIGANYWAAVVIEAWSALRRRWVDARAALPGIFVFTTLTGVVSIANRAQFDVGHPFTWIWMGVYTLFPVVMIVAWLRQRRAQGEESRDAPLPQALRVLLGLLAVVLLAFGAALILYPVQAGAAWAWQLTPPDAAYRSAGGASVEGYVGCWLVGVGVVIGGALVENDSVRARPVFAGMTMLLLLQIHTVVRFGAEIDWSRPQAWGFGAMLVLIGVSGGWGLISSRRVSR